MTAFDFNWLKKNALFGCQNEGCAEEYSHNATDLRLHNGLPICESCYDEVEFEHSRNNFELDVEYKEIPSWGKLPSFHSFENLTETTK